MTHDWTDSPLGTTCTRCKAVMSQGPDARSVSACPGGDDDA